MSTQHYELHVLLDLRERARDKAQDEVAARVSELATAKKEVARREAALLKATKERLALREKYAKEAASGQGHVAGLYQVSNYLRALREDEAQLAQEIEGAKHDVIKAQRGVDEARQQLVEAATELEAVLTHHRNWAAEQRLLADRKQSAAMDDIAARIWREKKP